MVIVMCDLSDHTISVSHVQLHWALDVKLCGAMIWGSRIIAKWSLEWDGVLNHGTD